MNVNNGNAGGSVCTDGVGVLPRELVEEEVVKIPSHEALIKPTVLQEV